MSSTNMLFLDRAILELHQITDQSDCAQERHILETVFISDGAQVATDGHQMVVLNNKLQDPDNVLSRFEYEQFCIPADVCALALKGAKKPSRSNPNCAVFFVEYVDQYSANLNRIDHHGRKMTFKFDTYSGGFPDYTKVIESPQTKQTGIECLRFDILTMQKFSFFLQSVDASTTVKFNFQDEFTPIRSELDLELEPFKILAKEEQPRFARCQYLLMPCRL